LVWKRANVPDVEIGLLSSVWDVMGAGTTFVQIAHSRVPGVVTTVRIVAVVRNARRKSRISVAMSPAVLAGNVIRISALKIRTPSVPHVMRITITSSV